jgi:hypothetical protein
MASSDSEILAAGQHIGQGRFARPVRPHDGVNFAIGNGQVNAAQDRLFADSGMQIAYLKHGSSAHE